MIIGAIFIAIFALFLLNSAKRRMAILRSLHFLTLSVLLLGGLSQAHAQTCGQEGGQPCPVWVRIPSCDANLVESGAKCIHPACGRERENACTVNIRIPSCDTNLVETNGRCDLSAPCGAEGQRACPVWKRIPSCDANLIEANGMCSHPACGRAGQNACTINVRVPSCDTNLVETNGRCDLPTPCGAEGQRACPVWKRIPSCDANLIEANGMCAHPACGRAGQNACTVNVRVPSCDNNLIEKNGRCDLPITCGAEGQRACPVWNRIPSCDVNLIESGGMCSHPPCGQAGQNACTINVRIPSCDTNLVEANGRCDLPTPCGTEGQRACPVWKRIPSCDANLIESGGMCSHPACGRVGQSECTVNVRIPSCDTDLVEVHGRCDLPTPCGAEGQRACPVWRSIPSCNANLVESSGMCIHPACGREGENACTVNIRIPSCDASLIESGGKCLKPVPCGAEGQRVCTLLERVNPCDTYFVPASGMCAHPPCGKDGQNACTVNIRIPSCDANLIESNGRCSHPQCGTEGQRACLITERIPSCDANLIEIGGLCIHPPCGKEGQDACFANVRIPSCDSNLIELAGKCIPGVPCDLPDARVNNSLPINAPVVRISAENNTDRLGQDYRGFDLAQADPNLCQLACSGETQCQAWTYVKPNIQTAAARCYLKTGTPNPTPNACCVSGTKQTSTAARPTGIKAMVVNSSTVRISWQATPGATRYQLWRDYQLIQSNLTAATFDDKALPAGSHRYAVQSVYADPRGTVRVSAPSNEVTMRVGPFVVVAIGDSVMWGQGLSDNPGASHKFTGKVREFLQTSLGKDVKLSLLAHSGSNITPPTGSTPSQENDATPGEIPNTFPTITKQIELAAFEPGRDPRDVDLVLVNGCINDLNVRSILNPVTKPAELRDSIVQLCGERMKDLLIKVRERFPSARIALTGYYPLVSPRSDLTAVGGLIGATEVLVGTAAGLAGVPYMNPVTGAIVNVTLTEVLKAHLVVNSSTFYLESTLQLAKAAREANAKTGGGVSFACTPYTEQNAYAAPHSWLWLVPTPLLPVDDMLNQRGRICSDDQVLLKKGSTPDSLTLDRIQCKAASMGHPNIPGAEAYFDAIKAQITPFIPAWKAQHATRQSAP